MGDVLYHGAAVMGNQSFDLFTCFAALKAGEDLYFNDLGQERALDVVLLLPSAGKYSNDDVTMRSNNPKIVAMFSLISLANLNHIVWSTTTLFLPKSLVAI